MKRQTKKLTVARLCSLLLLALLLLPCFTACKARPLAQSRLAKTEVGEVGEYSVLYEELYFLAYNYCESIKDQYKNDPAGLEAAVWQYVNENIVANYAILELCATEGLIYNEKELKNDVEEYIELLIDSEFDGNRSDYLESQKVVGATDHYVRFVTGVDMLYDRLATKYKESGVVPNTDKEIMDYIKSNFAHTWHIAILIDGNDSREGELAKAKEALAKLQNGSDMYDLIGSAYNEDVNMDTLTDTFGHYFPRGVMSKEYEDTAFALNVNEISDIVEGTAMNSKGEYVDCFYIIQRLPTDQTEINKNLIALTDIAHMALISEKMEAMKSNLSFTPNEYARSLDITNLEAPKNGVDYVMILTISACVIAVASLAVLIIAIRKSKVKRFHKQLQAKKK